MEENKNEDLEKKIMTNLETTGFITELKVGSILTKNNWQAFPSRTYTDKDEDKSREIDIIASKVEYDEELNFQFQFEMVIEIKNLIKTIGLFSLFHKRKYTQLVIDSRW